MNTSPGKTAGEERAGTGNPSLCCKASRMGRKYVQSLGSSGSGCKVSDALSDSGAQQCTALSTQPRLFHDQREPDVGEPVQGHELSG